jgi:hypothetical protein
MSKLTKMRFNMLEDEGYDATAEWLWVMPLPDGLFSVDSIPFEMMGISVDDHVSGHFENGHLNFDRVVQQSGNRTIRIKFKHGHQEEIVNELGLEGVEFEGSLRGDYPLYAFNLSRDFDYALVRDTMDAMEATGLIEYEEGNV